MIKPPLAGDGWLVTSACCGPNPHRDLRLVTDGLRIETGEIFAVDWGRLKGNKLFREILGCCAEPRRMRICGSGLAELGLPWCQ